jgi:hypothetical protein
MGNVRPEVIPRNIGTLRLRAERGTSKTVVLNEMKKMLSYVNRAICDRAHLSYDNSGFIRSNVALFGVTLPPNPETMTSPGTGHYRAHVFSQIAAMMHNIVELTLVKLRVVPWPAVPGLALIRKVMDRKKFLDMFGNAEENAYCEVWSEAELNGFELLVEKSTTCGYAPMLRVETDFFRFSSETVENPCALGFLQLGQVAAIKDRDDWKPHTPEHGCIVIDTRDVREAIVYDLVEHLVVSVPHSRLVVPEFLMPWDYKHSVQRSVNIIREIEKELEEANAAAVVAMEAPNAFPEAAPEAAPMDEGEDENDLMIVEGDGGVEIPEDQEDALLAED